MNSLRAIFPLLAGLAVLPASSLGQIRTGESTPAPPLFGPSANGTPAPTSAPTPPPPATGPATAPSTKPPLQDPGAPDPSLAVDGIDFGKQAKIPYEALIKIAQSDATQPQDAKIYTLRISSKIGSVKPDKIELYLDRENGPQILKVDPNGFFSVPHDELLLKENPELVSNQPKGSLNLEVKLSLPKPELPKITDGRVRYQALFQPILDLNESMRKMDPNFGRAGHQQFAIEVKTGAEGGVRLQRQFGARTLQPDAAGQIWFVFDPILFDENPEIQVMPLDAEFAVRPVTAEQATEIRSR